MRGLCFDLIIGVFQILVAPQKRGQREGRAPAGAATGTSNGAHAWRPYGQSHLDDIIASAIRSKSANENAGASGVALCLPFDLEGSYALPKSLPEQR